MYLRAQGLIGNSFSAFWFGLERSSYTVVESDGVVSVCVTADRGDGTEVHSVSLLTINITTQGKFGEQKCEPYFNAQTIQNISIAV